MPSFTARIEHVIAVMFENRSFDHLLGSRHPFPTGILGSGPGDLVPNLDPETGKDYLPKIDAGYGDLANNVGHEPHDVAEQTGIPIGGPVPSVPNAGFVANYRHKFPNPNLPDAPLRCFSKTVFPALSQLADKYLALHPLAQPGPGAHLAQPVLPSRLRSAA